jgi:hypothetical protein
MALRSFPAFSLRPAVVGYTACRASFQMMHGTFLLVGMGVENALIEFQHSVGVREKQNGHCARGGRNDRFMTPVYQMFKALS